MITADSRAKGFDLRELWQYRDLLRLFIRRDFVAFYKQTILGPVWIFIQPLLTSLVYMLVFHRLAGLLTDQLPPIMFYLAGVSCWTFFADCLTKTSETLIANALLYEKVYFPRMITPLSVVASSMIRLIIQLGLFGCLWVWYVGKGVISTGWMLLAAPLFVILLAAMGLGVGLIFAAATNKYRDLRFLLQFGIPLLMFATPVFYPLSMVSEKGAHGTEHQSADTCIRSISRSQPGRRRCIAAWISLVQHICGLDGHRWHINLSARRTNVH